MVLMLSGCVKAELLIEPLVECTTIGFNYWDDSSNPTVHYVSVDDPNYRGIIRARLNVAYGGKILTYRNYKAKKECNGR